MPKEVMKDMGYHHHKGKGTMALILGLLILANAYWMIVGWDYFIGIMLVLAGIVKLMKK